MFAPMMLRHVGQDLGQARGVVGLVDVLDVLVTVPVARRVADVVDVEAQALGQVVEPVELDALVVASQHGLFLQPEPKSAEF
jgi:hypothetical protein